MAAFRMLRTLATSAAVVLIAGLTAVAPAAATTDDRSAAVSTPNDRSPALAVLADEDDFSYASWDADYRLGLDEEGRATLHVTEEIVARFPDVDQNRGIVRGLATSYEGAGLDTRVLSVSDGDGRAVPFETETDDGVLYVLTGDDDFVHGLTTYVIEYRMRDVMLAADSGVDEFYWDLLPLDSTQAIERFSAAITVDSTLAEALTGRSSCYQGPSGSTESCAIEGPVEADDGVQFRVASGERAAGDGVTVAIAFEPGTAVQPPARLPDPVSDLGPIVGTVGTIAVSVVSWLAVRGFAKRRRTASGIVIAQYDVPADLPPLLAAALLPRPKAVIPAEIVHLAVRGLLRIEEGPSPAQPRLRRLRTGPAPDPLDGEALQALFPSDDAVGTDADAAAGRTDAPAAGSIRPSDADVMDIPGASEAFAARMTVLTKQGQEEAAARGLTERRRSRAAMILQTIALALAVGALGVAIAAVSHGRLAAIPALVIASFGALLVLASSLYAFARHTVLTPQGAARYEYLQGVEEFIRVAEEDRLRMLQSYSGAERRTDGSADVVLVYEKLLPYAILFGQEDEWARVLESAYAVAHHGPGWIGDGRSPAFSSTLAAFAVSTSAASSYSAPSTSASSGFGGSAGGGFSGGGGGGGFSGGR